MKIVAATSFTCNSTNQNDNHHNEVNHYRITKNEPTPELGTRPGSAMADEEEQQQRQKRGRIEIEGYKRFSQSIIWDLMMRFYDDHGEKAWADGIVPHFVSSNEERLYW